PLHCLLPPPDLDPSPTRRSSDLREMVDLLRRLIVPRAPCLAAVERDDRALVVSKENALAVRRIDPHLLWIDPTNGQRILFGYDRSEEHTSELQSLAYLVCRLLLE